MSTTTTSSRDMGRRLWQGGLAVLLSLLTAVAMAQHGGGGHGGGGHGGGGHGGHGGGGHAGGGHGSGGHGGGGHVDHGNFGGHGGGHGHHHGHGFFGFAYTGYLYPTPYYRNRCHPYSRYYDPVYCERYYRSNHVPSRPAGVIIDGVVYVPVLPSPEAPDVLP